MSPSQDEQEAMSFDVDADYNMEPETTPHEAPSEPPEDSTPEAQSSGHAFRTDITLTASYKGQQYTHTFPSAATVFDLSQCIMDELKIPSANQKFLVSPKPGLLKPPFEPGTSSGSIPLTDILGRKITVLGSTTAELDSLNTAIARSQRMANRRHGIDIPKTVVSRSRTSKEILDAATYTFARCGSLQYLPNPDRSLRFLQRLRDDPGIKSVMAKHKWKVGMLLEMDPAMHTTHESKTLGLNRNKGEIIELRLRTDAYDGYRDYKTIRKTLCHELTHNVWSEHDANFWALCKQVEKEVDAADWKHGGRAVGAEEFYNPNDDLRDADVVDHGGWKGGLQVLGQSKGAAPAPAAGGDAMRELMAKAARDRADAKKRQEGAGDQGSSSQ